MIFGSEFNSNSRETALQTLNLNSNKTINDYFDLINTTISSVKESVYVYDLTHSLGNFMCDVELSNENLGSNKKEAIAGDFVISRLRSYLQEMAVIQSKDFRQLLSTEYLVYRPKTDFLSANTLMVFALTKEVQTILNHSQYGTEHPRFYEFVLNEMPIPNTLLELNNDIDSIMKEAYKLLESSKSLYKEAERLLYESLGLDSPLCHTNAPLRHTERDKREVSKPRESNSQNESMTDTRINELDSPLRHCDSSDLMSSDLDSSLRASHSAQNDDIGNIAQKYPHLNLSIRALSQSYGISGRLDSEYYQAKYDAIERKIRGYKGGYFRLQPSEIKDSNFTPKAQEKYRYIELANIGNNGNISEPLEDLGENLPTRARRKVKTGDFIMSSIEGSLASCAIITPEFDNCLVSTGFYVLDSAELNSETLLVLFKSAFFQEYLRKFSSGTILTAISKDELQNILIPKIDTATQEQIAQKIQKSFALREKSKSLLQSAKAKVEQAIENFS